MTFEIIEREYDETAYVWRLGFRADATPYQPVGFDAEIPVSGWRKQIGNVENEAFPTFWGSISLHSRGAESDRLLGLLASYYNIPAPEAEKHSLFQKIFGNKSDTLAATWKFANRIECFAVGINSDPALITDDVVRLKLFLEDGIPNGRFAEIFFNIDMPQGFAALDEKDEEYRIDLVHWLSLPGQVNANPYSN
ncbi:hypothetical protein [Novosphingobium beihaiensis]|uniref:Immunity protein 50 of polymorphic toxin system n=1 Tax=Novosphingobium beihaiensis TaxID=2930389 RepID=A0ABT0BQG4_9SPHN|nr:hypothetical protein [Novosphingobium beihaiensis]MCJ2187281.1 hypothetical protein [Novosphingobium beihaiensis]